MYSYAREEYYRKRTLAAKHLIDFIREHPEGVTVEDIKQKGLPVCAIQRLVQLGYVRSLHVPEPTRGPRAYHKLFRSSSVVTSAKRGVEQ